MMGKGILMKRNRSIAWFFTVLWLMTSCQTAPSMPEETAETEAVQPDTPQVTETASPETIPASGSRIIVDGKTRTHPLTDEEKAAYPQTTNLPALYIDLGEKKPSAIQHGVYTDARYSLVYNGEGIIGMPLQIKGRANYSWSFPQKPYTLKLEEAAPLLGMNTGKKWVLITTWSDKTLLRNYITLNLASELVGMEYSVQTRYVDVYLNGKYNGLYVLSQKIGLGDRQVDADALFEIEAQYRHADCSNCIIPPSGTHIMFVEPISDAADEEERERLMRTYRQLIVKADTAIMSRGIEDYSRFIDVDSFVDWYIVNELVKNYDSGFTTSCYMYAKDGKLHMGPCWDYDTCMGNQMGAADCLYPEGFHVAESGFSPWYRTLTKEEGFVQALHARWTELYESGKIAAFRQYMEDLPEFLSESRVLDQKKWPQKLKMSDLRGWMSRFTYDEELDYLKDWVDTRIRWLNAQWNENAEETDAADPAGEFWPAIPMEPVWTPEAVPAEIAAPSLNESQPTP